MVEKDADSEATYEDDDEEDQEYDETEIISIFNAFEDTPKDGHAYLALASFLVNNRCFAESEARGYALQAIELLQHDPRRLEAQLVLANADIILEELDEALNAVDIVLKEPDAPQHLLRRAYTTLANIQKDQGKLEEVAKSYELARQADPQEPMSGEDLYDEFYLYLEQQADATLIDRVGSWKTTEKLTIMTWVSVSECCIGDEETCSICANHLPITNYRGTTAVGTPSSSWLPGEAVRWMQR